MSEHLEITKYLKDLEEVGLPTLQNTLSGILKWEMPPLRLEVRKSTSRTNYVAIYSEDLRHLLGNTLVHLLFTKISLNIVSMTPYISNGDKKFAEGEILIPFRLGLSYTHPGGGQNGNSFNPEWLYWQVSEKQWVV